MDWILSRVLESDRGGNQSSAILPASSVTSVFSSIKSGQVRLCTGLLRGLSQMPLAIAQA